MRELLNTQEGFIERMGEETATCKFGISVFTGGSEWRATHFRYGHCAVHHGPLGKHLERALGRKLEGASDAQHCPCNACLKTRMSKFAKPKDQEHRRPADKFLDRWHTDGKVMFGIPYLIIVDEALSTPWALLGLDRADLMREYQSHKQREEVHARRRLGALDVVECRLREQRSDGAREFTSALVREAAERDGTKLELRAAGDAE